eukprot:m51a1_g5219 hypothetical protein (240) ;mRNA; f:264415-265134
MRLVMYNSRGRAFFVFKPWTRRQGDPDAYHAARSLEHGRVYTTTGLRHLEDTGAILRPPCAPGVVLVAQDSPAIVGGRAQGFWKLLQRRLRLKHASCAVDRALMPELKDVEAWLLSVRGPQPCGEGLDSLFPLADEVSACSPAVERSPGDTSQRTAERSESEISEREGRSAETGAGEDGEGLGEEELAPVSPPESRFEEVVEDSSQQSSPLGCELDWGCRALSATLDECQDIAHGAFRL